MPPENNYTFTDAVLCIQGVKIRIDFEKLKTTTDFETCCTPLDIETCTPYKPMLQPVSGEFKTRLKLLMKKKKVFLRKRQIKRYITYYFQKKRERQ